MPTGGGTITSVCMYHVAGASGKNMILGVYSNGTNNLPSTRLALTASTQIATTTCWQTINLISPVNVAGGTKIWLSWIYQTNPGIKYQSGTPARASSGVSWSTTGDNMPSTFGTSTNSSSNIFSIYTNYTTGYTLTTNVSPSDAGTVKWLHLPRPLLQARAIPSTPGAVI